MTPERHQRAKELFVAARAVRAEEVAAFLARECGADAELRTEVESLLAQASSPAEPRNPDAETTLAEAACLGRSPGLVGRRLGKFRLKRIMGSGGMGTVYEAIEEFPRRVVALKVMKSGIASRAALKRFEYEAQILARLRHPGIAQIYEAGVHEEGGERLPYFAMEYVPSARPITEYAKEQKLSTRERLELFARVCEAVHHGHQKAIIHRDLKPSNILVDSNGQPKVIDFGVARSTDSDLAVTTLQTDVGQLIGTLQYMSPEQCAADPHDLDTRSDVYALGVVLYELLTEQLPYDLSKAAVHEAARVIREEVPARPSTIIRALRGDVETIALKALEKDRSRRYQSALDLEQDLRRYLNAEPISARPPSLGYQVRMFARRNKVAFRAGVALLVVLVLGIIGTGWQAHRAHEHAREAVRAQRVAQAAAAQESLAHERTRKRERQLIGMALLFAYISSDTGAALITHRTFDELRRHRRSSMDTAGASVELSSSALKSFDDAAHGLLIWPMFQSPEHLEGEITSEFSEDPLVCASLLESLAFYYHSTANFDRAASLQERAIATYAQAADAEHLLSGAEKRMSLLRLAQGRIDELDACLPWVATGLPDVGPAHYAAIVGLGALYWLDGRFDDGELFVRRALDEQASVGVKGDFVALTTKVAIGEVLACDGKWSDAERYFQEAVTDLGKQSGVAHGIAGRARLGLGRVLTARGSYAEAEGELLLAEGEMRSNQESRHYRECGEALVALYETWDRSEPGLGYDAKATPWRKRVRR